ncbi:MAG TPA: hypothetical protein VFZ96_01795 [Actinomycetota bacterium]|nr:hypothetical protein [Actinomycetota bacterium]
MAGSAARRRRWAGLAVSAAVVAGLATFPGGGAVAFADEDPPVTVPQGVLRLHLGADGNRFTYEEEGSQNISVSGKCVVSLAADPQFVELSAKGAITGTSDGVAADVGFAPYGLGARYSEGKGTSCGRVDADQSLTLSLAGTLQGKVVTAAQLDIEGKFNVVVQADLFRAGQHVGTVHLSDPAFSDNGPDAGKKDNVRWVIETDLDSSTAAKPEPFDSMVLTPKDRVGSFSLEGGADGTPAVGEAGGPEGVPLVPNTRDSLFEISTYYGDQLDCAETITDSGSGITFTITRLNVGPCTVDVPYNVTFSRNGTDQDVFLAKDESIVDVQEAEFLVDIVWAPEPAETPVPATLITLPGGSPTEVEWCNPGPALSSAFPWCLTAQESILFGTETAPDNEMQVTDHFYGKFDPAFSRR